MFQVSCSSQNWVRSNDTSSLRQVGFFRAAAFYKFPSTFPRISLKFWPRCFAAARGEGWQAPNDTYWGSTESTCEPTEYVTTCELAPVHTTYILSGGTWRHANLCASEYWNVTVWSPTQWFSPNTFTGFDTHELLFIDLCLLIYKISTKKKIMDIWNLHVRWAGRNMHVVELICSRNLPRLCSQRHRYGGTFASSTCCK